MRAPPCADYERLATVPTLQRARVDYPFGRCNGRQRYASMAVRELPTRMVGDCTRTTNTTGRSASRFADGSSTQQNVGKSHQTLSRAARRPTDASTKGQYVLLMRAVAQSESKSGHPRVRGIGMMVTGVQSLRDHILHILEVPL